MVHPKIKATNKGWKIGKSKMGLTTKAMVQAMKETKEILK